MADEIWKPVVSFGGFFKNHYEVSSLGRVRRSNNVDATGRTRPQRPALKPAFTAGYARLTLCHKGVRKNALVHLLVLEAFVGQRPDGMQACHFPNDSTDNSLANLRWDTTAANAHDRVKAGTAHVGEKHGRSVLTEEAISKIKKRLAENESHSSIAKDFGVHKTTITAVNIGLTWGHVK